MKKIQNFDDVDLGIIGIVILGIGGFATGIFLKADVAALFGFAATCVTGVAALVRGAKRIPSDEAPPADN